MFSHDPVIVDTYFPPLPHMMVDPFITQVDINVQDIEPQNYLQLPSKPKAEPLFRNISNPQLLGLNLDEKTPQEILDKYDEMQKSRTTWSNRFKSMKQGFIEATVWTLSTVEGFLSYTSKGMTFLTDPGQNLLKDFPKVASVFNNILDKTKLPVGIFSGVVGIILSPYQFFKTRKIKNTVESHIQQLNEPTAIKLADRQFIDELTRQLKNKDTSLEDISDWFNQQGEGLQLDTVLDELPNPPKKKDKKHLLKAFNDTSNINFTLAKRDESVSKNFMSTLEARVNTTYDYAGQLEIANQLILSEDISIVSLYESLSGKSDLDEHQIYKSIIENFPGHGIEEIMEEIEQVKDDPLELKKLIHQYLQGKSELKDKETVFARRFAHTFFDVCEGRKQRRNWEHIRHNKLVMFGIRHNLGMHGVTLDPNMSLSELKQKLASDKGFRRHIEYAFHSKEKTISKVQEMLTSRQKQEVKRVRDIKESSEYQSSLQSLATLSQKEGTTFVELQKAFTELGIDITKIPSTDDENFPTYYDLQEYLEEIEEGLKQKDLPEEEVIVLINERAKILKQIRELPITTPISTVDEIIEFVEDENLFSLLTNVGAQQKATRVETLSALSRNGLKEVSKEKAKRERSLFNFTWFKAKVMAPIGFSMSVISITSLALVALGVIATAPVWLTPLGWAVFGLGVMFTLAGLIHQIRNKPRLLYENTIKLRGVRKFFRNIPFKFHGWRLEKNLAKLRNQQIIQRLITLKISNQDVNEMLDHLETIKIPNHLREILEQDFKSLGQSEVLSMQHDLDEYLDDYNSQINALKVKVRKKNRKVTKHKAKLQKHIDKLQEAGIKDTILGGYKIEDWFKKEKPNRVWKELGLNFDQFVKDKSLLEAGEPTPQNAINIAEALLAIDQAGGMDPALKEIMLDRMGINVDRLKRMDKGKIIDFIEQLPKELQAFFGSSISNIFSVAKKMDRSPKFSSIYY